MCIPLVILISVHIFNNVNNLLHITCITKSLDFWSRLCGRCLTYDRVEWRCLEQIMQKMGFAESWIGLGYEMHQHGYLCRPH